MSAKDTTNTILGKDADKALWYRIRVTNGNIDITGWIRAVHVESDDDLSGVPVAWTPVRLSFDSNANVRATRSGPDAGYATVGSIAAGTKYPVLGKDSDQDAWYEIQYDPTHPDCTGWVPAAQAQIHDAEADIQQDALPVTWLPPLPADHLQQPVMKENNEGKTTGHHPITSLFNDPRRGPGGWDPTERHYHKHEGIDWGCPEGTSVCAMIGGTVVADSVVTNSPDSGYGNQVTIFTRDPKRGLFFRLTYAHLKSVTKQGGEVLQGEEVGISGNTGNSSGPHLHVHYVPRDDGDTISTVNWPDFFHSRNYHDFHAALKKGHPYIWPDTAALQAESDTAPEAGRDKPPRTGSATGWTELLLGYSHGQSATCGSSPVPRCT